MKTEKSFTLIELLVIIAIIGLLSSVVFVVFGNQRQKARTLKNLELSESIHRALGAYAIGIWSFDDCPAGTANDTSGYNNHGTINGALCLDHTPHKIAGITNGKYALSFDGSSSYVSTANFNWQASSDFTISLWAYMNDVIRNQPFLGKPFPQYEYVLLSRYQGTELSFVYWGGVEGRVSDWQANLKPERWYHFVVVHKGSEGRIRLYNNGKLAATGNTGSGYINRNFPMYIGRSYPWVWGQTYSFDGLIDEVRIYEEALSLSQVQQLYAEAFLKYHLAESN